MTTFGIRKVLRATMQTVAASGNPKLATLAGTVNQKLTRAIATLE